MLTKDFKDVIKERHIWLRESLEIIIKEFVDKGMLKISETDMYEFYISLKIIVEGNSIGRSEYRKNKWIKEDIIKALHEVGIMAHKSNKPYIKAADLTTLTDLVNKIIYIDSIMDSIHVADNIDYGINIVYRWVRYVLCLNQYLDINEYEYKIAELDLFSKLLKKVFRKHYKPTYRYINENIAKYTGDHHEYIVVLVYKEIVALHDQFRGLNI